MKEKNIPTRIKELNRKIRQHKREIRSGQYDPELSRLQAELEAYEKLRNEKGKRTTRKVDKEKEKTNRKDTRIQSPR